MRTSEANWHLVVFQHFHCSTGPVIRGIICKEHSGLSPIFIMAIQPLHQLLQEDLHDFIVSVALDQRVEYFSVGVYRGYD